MCISLIKEPVAGITWGLPLHSWRPEAVVVWEQWRSTSSLPHHLGGDEEHIKKHALVWRKCVSEHTCKLPQPSTECPTGLLTVRRVKWKTHFVSLVSGHFTHVKNKTPQNSLESVSMGTTSHFTNDNTAYTEYWCGGRLWGQALTPVNLYFTSDYRHRLLTGCQHTTLAQI